MARQHGHPPVTFLGKGGSWIQNTLAPPCGSRWRCHGRVRLVLIFFLLIPFLFKQWWSGSGGPGRSQRVTTPHCSCGTTQTSRAWGAPPTDSVLEPELDTPQSQVKGGWLLLVCHFLDALQTFYENLSYHLVVQPSEMDFCRLDICSIYCKEYSRCTKKLCWQTEQGGLPCPFRFQFKSLQRTCFRDVLVLTTYKRFIKAKADLTIEFVCDLVHH